jgi:hypothetical protein
MAEAVTDRAAARSAGHREAGGIQKAGEQQVDPREAGLIPFLLFGELQPPLQAAPLLSFLLALPTGTRT